MPCVSLVTKAEHNRWKTQLFRYTATTHIDIKNLWNYGIKLPKRDIKPLSSTMVSGELIGFYEWLSNINSNNMEWQAEGKGVECNARVVRSECIASVTGPLLKCFNLEHVSAKCKLKPAQWRRDIQWSVCKCLHKAISTWSSLNTSPSSPCGLSRRKTNFHLTLRKYLMYFTCGCNLN